MISRLLVVCLVGWYFFGPTWCCLINNCPTGGKRSALMALEERRQSHQKRAKLWNDRNIISCNAWGAEGVCVGPLCCDPSRSEGDPGSKCGVDYKTCGSSREVMEEYALCLSKGLACDLNTLKCCNMYDYNCFDSIMCRDKSVGNDFYKDRDPPQIDLSDYMTVDSITFEK
ncbi:hypothetical protein M8J77_013837 [Diaphorina citri]|nr:hypothetical protein M8J77_013837 [Diaphorina citri]